MSEPKRWIDEEPPAAVEQLLRAAAAERPMDQSLARALSAVGVGVGAAGAATAGAATASAATVGAATAGAGAKAGGFFAATVLVKWGAAGAVLAASVVAGKVVLERAAHDGARPRAASAAVAPHRVEASSRQRQAAASAVAPAPALVPEPPPAAPPPLRSAAKARHMSESPRAVVPPPEDTEHLAEEVALVDRARGALANGDAGGALSALDDYEARFSRRKFAPEALYLRMEALLRAGRAGAARSVAEALARTYPTSPHAARARQVLEETIP